MSAVGEAQLTALLDFSQPLDVALLDQVVKAFYMDNSKELGVFMVAFQQHPLAWTRVDTILDRSTAPETRMLATIILESTIKTRWKVLPPEQRQGIKTYVVNLIIKLSSDPKSLAMNKTFLTKLNMVLVQIVKQEWPDQWPNFIPELVNSSKTSQSLCANNMNILMLLSEEVFDFSSGQMTQEKMKTMKKNLNREFTLIFQLCEYILDHSSEAALLTETLRTLLRFLHWIPIGYIFETKLIETLALKFFPMAQFQNDTLACLTEIGGLKLREEGPGGVATGPLAGAAPGIEVKYNACFINLFLAVMSQVCKLIQPETDIAAVYNTGADAAQTFVRHLALFITAFLKAHISLVEQESDATRAALGQAISILLRISRVDDLDIFKICLEYWNILVTDLYNTQRAFIAQHGGRMLAPGSGLLGGVPALTPTLNSGLNSSTNAPRLVMYLKSLSELRIVLISKMAKPEEVLIEEDENGEIVRATMKDTVAITLYKSMREALIYLTHLDPEDAQASMLRKLDAQVDTGPNSEWSWNNLNTLCWAIGSISGALSPTAEKSFLVKVIKDLLNLCEQKRGKDHKAVIASNIMYVVGQYPRFLREHWKFLKTVVNKLFEFMHELHPGVQDMSVDTFLKIAKKCVVEGTPVALANGTAVPIEQIRAGDSVLARDAKDGLSAHAVTEVLDQGRKACVQLRFSDGRTLTCTDDHRILTAQGVWVTAGKLVVGQDEVTVGPECPVDERSAPAEDERDWSLDLTASLGYSLTMAEPLARERALAFARLAGYAAAAPAASVLELVHAMDAAAVQADASLMSASVPAARRSHVTLPRPLMFALETVGVAAAASSHSARLPAFLLAPTCPLAVLREFLGAYFGRSGRSAELAADGASFTPISWACSVSAAESSEREAALRAELLPLLARFGLHFSVASEAASEVETTLQAVAASADTLAFAQRIGFRYSSDKQLRLSAACAVLRACTEGAAALPELLDKLDARKFFTASFAAKSSASLPTFRVRVIERVDAGVRAVYDLSVPRAEGEDYESFLAAGLAVHNCRRKFVQVQAPTETRPFIDEILDDMQTTIKHLEVGQIHVFYEAVGEIIQVETDPNKRQQLVFKLMELPNQTWAELISRANHDAQTLFNPLTVKRFILVLKTNNRVAGSLGAGYIVQLARIYVDMLQVYKMYSGYISLRIQERGPIVTKEAVIRSMRAVKKETLNLIRTFISQSQEMDRDVILNNFIPALLEPVLDDYSRGVPDARDSEVLLLLSEIIAKLGLQMVERGHIQRIFESVFQCTLDMITKNFEDYPDHRLHFFRLLEMINRHAFPALLRLNAAQFKLIMDSVIWAVKHLERNIADTGLQILFDLINNVQQSDVANEFYKAYFISLLQDILGVLTDTLHKPGFRLQSLILQKLFQILDSGAITVPLWVSASNPDINAFPNNAVYVRQFVSQLLLTAFPNLTAAQVDQFVLGLFTTQKDVNLFKTHLRDFFVRLKEFGGDAGTEDLFLEEKKAQEALQRQAQQAQQAAVPGLEYHGGQVRSTAVDDDDITQ